MEARPPSFHIAAMSVRPSPLKSPGNQTVLSIQPPASLSQWAVENCLPSDVRTVSTAVPPLFHAAARSDKPSPLKSPEAQCTESPQPPCRTFHWAW